MTPEGAAAVSRSICATLLALPETAAARVVALYHAMAGEIDLGEAFGMFNRQEKETLLPRFNRAAGMYEMVKVSDWLADTVEGHYGIREPLPQRPPIPARELVGAHVLWCVPGVAFDAAGHRLGRGKGYYDRLLSSVDGVKIGIAHQWQIVPSIPMEAHDVGMDLIVTEQGCRRCAA